MAGRALLTSFTSPMAEGGWAAVNLSNRAQLWQSSVWPPCEGPGDLGELRWPTRAGPSILYPQDPVVPHDSLQMSCIPSPPMACSLSVSLFIYRPLCWIQLCQVQPEAHVPRCVSCWQPPHAPCAKTQEESQPGQQVGDSMNPPQQVP